MSDDEPTPPPPESIAEAQPITEAQPTAPPIAGAETLAGQCVPPPGRVEASQAAPAPDFIEGQTLFVNTAGDRYWRPATVSAVGDEQLTATLENGGDVTVSADRCHADTIAPGSRVYADFKQQGKYYACVVLSRRGDKLRVRYRDDEEEDTDLKHVATLHFHPGEWRVGDAVFGRWSGDGHWYHAEVIAASAGGYRIRWDDQTEADATGDDLMPDLVRAGESVFAQWARDGKYYPAKIDRREGDRVAITYSDGTREETTVAKLAYDVQPRKQRRRRSGRASGAGWADASRDYSAAKIRAQLDAARYRAQADAYRAQSEQLRAQAVRRAEEQAAREMRRYRSQMSQRGYPF